MNIGDLVQVQPPFRYYDLWERVGMHVAIWEIVDVYPGLDGKPRFVFTQSDMTFYAPEEELKVYVPT